MIGLPSLPPAITRIVGAVLLVASLGFVAYSVAQVDFGAALGSLDGGGIAVLCLLSAGYAASLGLLAMTWRLMLDTGDKPAAVGAAMSVYGSSVLAKYLPGSIFQYASRQALGARQGWRQAALAKASAAEIVLHLIAALAVFVIFDRLLGLGQIAGWAVALVAVAAAGGMVWLAGRPPEWRARITGAVAGQLAFFALLVLIAAACAQLAGADQRMALEVGALFLLAWLVGFVAPGAPGGIGVREAGILITVSGLMGVEPALLFAAATRLVTLAGDILFAGAAFAIARLPARIEARTGR